ncbi:hypothetical protein [Nocardia sp. NPDC049707]|uniref:hypothetical protein n=1 Tax=Nocardia sp. NPDC049707 TaxID=3154735 RepID=UPI00343E880F
MGRPVTRRGLTGPPPGPIRGWGSIRALVAAMGMVMTTVMGMVMGIMATMVVAVAVVVGEVAMGAGLVVAAVVGAAAVAAGVAAVVAGPEVPVAELTRFLAVAQVMWLRGRLGLVSLDLGSGEGVRTSGFSSEVSHSAEFARSA